MGKVCSKCLGVQKYKEGTKKNKEGTKKNKEGTKKKKIAQPEQNADSGKVLTNKGKIIDPRDIGEDDGKQPQPENDRKQPERKPDPQKKNSTRKKTKRGQNSLEDSSDTSSSSSDLDPGYTRNSRKVKRNSGGGTTIVNKTVNVNGSYNKFQDVDTVVLTINTGPPKKKKKKKPDTSRKEDSTRRSSQGTGPCKEFFSNYHTAESLREQIRSLTATDPISNPVGFSVPKHNNFEDVYVLRKVLEMAASVCKIIYPGGFATGIRVGPCYVMTPLHVLHKIIYGGEHRDFVKKQSYSVTPFAALEREVVYAVFNYDSQHTDPIKFHLCPEVHFLDHDTDIALVKLQANLDGHAMPPAFKYFSIPNSKFIFIGHPQGETKKTEIVKNIVQLNDATKREITELRHWSLESFNKQYDYTGHIDSIHRLLFKSDMTEGASGSPGLVLIDNKHVAVVTICLHRYPDLLYDDEVPQSQKSRVLDSYRISQGANMYSVYLAMREFCESLCDEIFHSWQDE